MPASSWKWREFDDFFNDMNQPSGDIALDRISENLDYFRLNYLLTVSITILLTSIIRPNFLLIALPIVIAAGCFFGLVYEQPIRIGDNYITVQLLARMYSLLCIILIAATSGAVFFIILLMNIVLILLHAYLKGRGPLRKIKSIAKDFKSNNNPLLDRACEVLELCLGLNDSGEIYNGRGVPKAAAQRLKASLRSTLNTAKDTLNDLSDHSPAPSPRGSNSPTNELKSFFKDVQESME